MKWDCIVMLFVLFYKKPNEWDRQREELYRLMATGRNDFLWQCIQWCIQEQSASGCRCCSVGPERCGEGETHAAVSPAPSTASSCLTLLSRSPAPPPQHHWPFWSAYWVCWHQLLSVCCPSTPQQTEQHWPPQTHRIWVYKTLQNTYKTLSNILGETPEASLKYCILKQSTEGYALSLYTRTYTHTETLNQPVLWLEAPLSSLQSLLSGQLKVAFLRAEPPHQRVLPLGLTLVSEVFFKSKLNQLDLASVQHTAPMLWEDAFQRGKWVFTHCCGSS